MKINGSELQTLGVIASCPFADRLELAAMSGASRSAVYEAVGGLEEAGLVAYVPHAADLIPPTRRYRITARGLDALAEAEGATTDDLLRSRPVSIQWLRILMDRLDALAVIYRLASTVAGVAHPVGLRLYRAGPLDAALTLPGGRTVGIARQGHAADRTGFSRRLWKLRDGPRPGMVLVLVADEVRLRHARRMLPRTVEALLALERDAALAGPEDEVWRPAASGPAANLRNALGQLAPGGDLPVEADPSQADPPGNDGPDADRALPVLLKPAEKRALDLIYDWPWLLRTELASLMAVSERRASQLVNPLEGFGLVTRPIDGSGRLALTERGIALLARRDRTSVAVARKRWSVTPVDYEAPLEWRNVTGGRSRQLLRNIEHTGAVHAFVAALARQALALGWELAQLDPPMSASRHFRHEGRNRSVNPDAFGVLRRGPGRLALLPGVGEESGAPLDDGDADRPLSALLLISQPHRRPRRQALRPDRLRRRHRRHQLPESGGGRDGPRRGQRAPVGLPQRRHRRAGPAGKGVEVSRRLGARPRPAGPLNTPCGTEVEQRLHPVPKGGLQHMEPERNEEPRGRRRRGARSAVRLDARSLWARLALLNRSQNWLAQEIGISSGYMSKLVTAGRAPSGRIRQRMLKALGFEDFHELFKLDEEDQDEEL